MGLFRVCVVKAGTTEVIATGGLIAENNYSQVALDLAALELLLVPDGWPASQSAALRRLPSARQAKRKYQL